MAKRSISGNQRRRAYFWSEPGVTVRPHLTAICYNIGGVTQECYDLFKHWLLQTRCTADVVILTETHWGLGKEDGRWTIPGWIVLTTADEHSRYSGVGVTLESFSDKAGFGQRT